MVNILGAVLDIGAGLARLLARLPGQRCRFVCCLCHLANAGRHLLGAAHHGGGGLAVLAGVGADFVQSLAQRLAGAAHLAAVRMHLLHLIASHHGELAFGSPVFPKTPEAVALHYIDNLDAKLEMFRGAYETSEALAPKVLQRKAPLPANVVLPLPSVLPLEPDGEDALP